MRGAVLMAVTALLAVAFGPAAMADQPVNWGLGLLPAASPVMEDIHSFHNLLLWVITIITIFVLGLMVYVMVRFNRKANPNPSTTTSLQPSEGDLALPVTRAAAAGASPTLWSAPSPRPASGPSST